MGFKYVIEHMEDDEDTPHAVPQWVSLEYKHMETLAGPGAEVHFTHLSHASCTTLASRLSTTSSDVAQGIVHHEGITDLLSSLNPPVPLSKVCLLDPKAPQALAPEDGDTFEWFLFGGILGDDPPRDRTGELRVLGFPTRHLGPVQMTTDTALGVTKMVVQDKIPLEKIPYIDYPTIVFNPKESVEMPFRYIANGTEPILPPGMREHLQSDLNQSFDF